MMKRIVLWILSNWKIWECEDSVMTTEAEVERCDAFRRSEIRVFECARRLAIVRWLSEGLLAVAT